MTIRLTCLSSVLALASAMPALAEMNFKRIAAFAVPGNMAAGEDLTRESSAEIIAATADGMTLVYTDSPLGVIGRVDITDPAAPKPLGNLDMGGEPTSVAISGGMALVGVNTSPDFVAPSGVLRAIDIASGAEMAACELGGQPDSVALAKDGSFLAIAIENERDEEVNDGALPQAPAGFVVKLPLAAGLPDCAAMQVIDLTGLAAVAPEDPEPEFVDVNTAGEIVVTLQENNHIVVIGADGVVGSHFSAGTVTLDGIDTKSDGKITLSGSKADVAREPDAVKWLDEGHFATANEGDWNGGSRSWTIFAKDGSVVYESGPAFEQAIAAIGHYPEHRSKSKGVEPESIEVGVFGGTPLVFVGSERGSVVGVYDVTDLKAPVLRQLLPSGVGPEGYAAIPSRDLLISANETDLGADGLARSHVMIFARAEGPAAYPTLTSAGAGQPIGWGALSGLAADPVEKGKLYAVSDSVYGAAPTIYQIDATTKPARIISATPVMRGDAVAQKLDLEGITTDGEGGFWLASEGRSDRLIPHAIYHVDAEGVIDEEFALPPELLAVETRFGFEGIAKNGDMLWMAMQREWGDDPKGQVKLVSYNVATEEWGAVRYPLEPAGEGWMGLSEITFHDGRIYIIERDNLVGDAAKVKKIFTVDMEALVPAPLGGELPVVAKTEFRDLIPELKGFGGYVVDKVEGFAIDASGEGYVVTDNDGVDDSSGETLFWSVGTVGATN